MAVSPKAKPKTRVKMTKSNKTQENSNKKMLIIAQEIKLAKILAGNNKTLRDRTLKKLTKWFEIREKQIPFEEDDFMRVWKGLFYYMWMADKPLFHEECAENISNLMNFENVGTSLLFFKCFIKTMINEWFGIDQLRLDKFLMLVRRILRRCFLVLRDSHWENDSVKQFQNRLHETILQTETAVPLGLSMHITEIYLEELSKVSKGQIPESLVLEFVRPFVTHLAFCREERLSQHIKNHIFRYLMKQSDAGIEYEARFNAWRQMGFPGGSIDALEKIEVENVDDEMDEDAGALDPRAGKVHVDLPALRFDCNEVARLLEEYRFKPGTNKKTRKSMTTLMQQFEMLGDGNYPLGIKKLHTKPKIKGESTSVKSSLRRLQKFEAQLMGNSKKAKTARERKKKIKEIVKEELEKYKNVPGNQPEDEETSSNSLEEFIARSEGGLLNGSDEKKNIGFVTPVKTGIKKRPPTPYPKKVKNPAVVEKRKLEKPSSESQKKFKRNSGLWEVDDITVTPSKPEPATTVSKNLIRKRKGSQRFENVDDKPVKIASRKYTPIVMEHLSTIPETPSKKTFAKKRSQRTHLAASTPQNSLVKNPFSTPPSSQKKVKIALDLNKSQDIREHIITLANSPKNPYDSSKQPGKNILKKKTSLPGTMNPFYKL